MKKNNIETSKDKDELRKILKKGDLEENMRLRLAEERNDSDQVIINISPDSFEQLQKEYFDMKETGYGGSYADFLRSKIRVTKANGGLISNYKIESRKP